MTSVRKETVGLLNKTGEMNCFLNTAVQALWFMEGFRESIQHYECPLPELPVCLLCDMKELFRAITRALKLGECTIEITTLRRHLAAVYSHTGEFNIGCTADAMEALATLLNSLHCVAVQDRSQGESTSVPCEGCPSHRAVGFTVLEQIQCACGATSEQPWDLCSFLHPFYVNELIEEGEKYDTSQLLNVPEDQLVYKIDCSRALSTEGRLPELIRKQWENLTLEVCIEDACELRKSRKTLRVLSLPKNYLVNLIWSSAPSQLEILQVLAAIPLTLDLETIYNDTESAMYCLKEIVLYGFGHYVLFIRNQRVWYKIDDEEYAKVRKGTWFSAVIDIVDNWFNPTGLVYTQTDHAESFDINFVDWLRIEKYVVKRDLEYAKMLKHYTNKEEQQLRNTFGAPSTEKIEMKLDPSSSLTTGTKILVEPNKVPLKSQQNWACSSCKFSNELQHDMCTRCFELKPGIKGWVCRICTYLNKETRDLCTSCRHSKEEEKEVHWKCKFCTTQNENGLHCNSCFQTHTDEIAWKCRNCQSNNSSAKKKCWNCRFAKEFRVCGLCKSKPTDQGTEYCTTCRGDLCIKCKSRERQPGESTCSTCATLAIKSSRRRTCGTNGLKTRVCPHWDHDRCSICQRTIQNTESKVCKHCRSITSHWECKKCKHTTKKNERICETCLPPAFPCTICKTMRSSPGRCSSCEYKTETFIATTVKRPTKPKHGKCSACRITLTLQDHRNCCLCSKRKTAQNCDDCGILKFSHFVCAQCVKVKWVCTSCGLVQDKSIFQCNCGFMNSGLRDKSRNHKL